MRSKGSRFTLGVWGLRVCSLDVVQTFATVRNHLQPFPTAQGRMAVPTYSKCMQVLQKGSLLEVSSVA